MKYQNQAKKSGGRIKLIKPLEHGVQDAVDLILENHRMIDITEIYNMYDTIVIDESDFILYTRFIKLLNEGHKDKLTDFFHE